MRHRNSQLTRLALVVGIVLPITAWGQASPQAEALFRDGKRLMKEGKLAEACAAFEGSERAEHNVATVLSLADCREKNHQYASAWALFLQADSQTRSDPSKATLNVTAKNRARALEPRMSYLTINVPDESRIPDLAVSRDGAPVDPAEWNRSIPADGGTHVIAGKAPGHESWSTTVTLRPEGDKQSVEVPKFKALPEIVNKPARDERGYTEGTQPMIEPNPYTPRRKVAIGVAAGGVVIGGVAIGLGISASSLDNEAVATCPMSACSPQNASDARNKNQAARRRALYANIGYATAVAAVGAGVVLWIVGKPAEPSKPDAEIAVVPTAGQVNGLAVMGRF
jgi:hypothetical protein